MAGNFEVFLDPEMLYRFRLLGPDGSVMAVSQGFEDKAAVAAGIAAVRECAGTGLVTDLSPTGGESRPAANAVPDELPAVVVPACDDQRLPGEAARLRTGEGAAEAGHGAALEQDGSPLRTGRKKFKKTFGRA
ncbi:DUF1508 domain-containing protein [Arthrobacter sp. SLBN-112]|uniref:DUF1508 domain-containing protein n=1 Tax=Arthrobacter sp. SLBN-112 TaxID=2768452 RepID=UPI0027B4A905|nr:DUF1508 domain-containing protein [Arthrobacter sp. SLBN-112]MDQ0798542.1 uncharacterized protein YegP (UPF0339 family) [Arthrobacter sp. SLBN-112]